jgi:hypothetical protein
MRTERRHFLISDALILIAAFGAGMGWMFALIRSPDPRLELFFDLSSTWRLLWSVAIDAYSIGVPIMAMLTLGILAVRLRRPRPILRHLRREPGVVACLAATVGWWAQTIWITIVKLAECARGGSSETWADTARYYLMGLPEFDVGLYVGIAWATQWFTGNWRPTNSWADRLGRAAGVIWILIYARFVIFDLVPSGLAPLVPVSL